MPNKLYDILYTCKVTRTGSVEATSEEEAKELFEAGEFEEGQDVNCEEIDLIQLKPTP